MKRARFGNLLLLLILTTVLLGGLVLQNGTLAASQQEASLVVPAIRYGDRFEYHEFFKGHDFDTNSGDRVVDHQRRVIHQVDPQPRIANDQAGRPYDTVQIRREVVPVAGGKYLGFNDWRISVQDYEPQHRNLVRLQASHGDRVDVNRLPVPGPWTTRADRNYSYIIAGPDFGAHWGNILVNNLWMKIALQGRSLTPGQNLSHLFGPMRTALLAGPESGMIHRMWVGDRGTLDGRPVIAVHFTEDEWDLEQDGDRGHEWYASTWWFSDELPVPVRIEFREDGFYARPDGGGSQWNITEVRTLVAYSPGPRPVSWGPEFVTMERPPPMVLDWSAQPYPTSGPKSRIPYPVEDAVRSIEQDLTLTTFRSWREANPGSRLVGLEGTPWTNTQTGAFAWRLTYAAPGGSTALAVNSVRLGPGILRNEEAGPALQLPAEKRLDLAWMPERIATLAGVDAIWRQTASEAAFTQGPNYVRWGYACDCIDQHDPKPRLREILYGRLDDEAAGSAIQTIVVDAATGHLRRAGASELHADFEGTVLKRLPFPSSGVAAKAADPSPGKAIGPWLVGASGLSLLVLFLVYVYPFMQQGAMTLYSKLVKNQLLDHTLRDQLVFLIKENPGIAQPALQKATRSGWSTLTYHLSILGQNNLVTSVRDGRHRRYFPVGVFAHSSLTLLAVLQNPRTREIYSLISSRAGTDRANLARLTHVTPAAVAWHLDRLRGHGLVRTEKAGRSVRYFTTTSNLQPGQAAALASAA